MMNFSMPFAFNHLLLVSLSLWHASSLMVCKAQDDPTMDEVELTAVYEVLEAINDEIGWKVLFPGNLCTGGPHGIVCDVYDNKWHVVELNLGWVSDYGNNPPCGDHATIHSSIRKFSHLKKLFFYKCFVNSFQFLPAELAALGGTLKHLTFQNNPGLIGTIPTELAHLVKLERLVMIDNGLEGSIPSELSDLKSLQQLVLSGNKLSGRIPKCIGNLQNLKVLDLNRNFLRGEIPPSLGFLSNLQKLDLSYNDLQESIPETFGNLQVLEFLDLSFNSFTGYLPDTFRHMTNIRNLLLHSNKLGGQLPDLWGNMSKLNSLKLSDSNYEGSIPASIGSLNRLLFLALDNNKFSGNLPVQLGELKNLYHVNLSSNLLSGRIPFSQAFLNRLGRNLILDNNLNLCSEYAFEGMGAMGVTLCWEGMSSSLHQLGTLNNGTSHETNGAQLKSSAEQKFRPVAKSFVLVILALLAVYI
ncbi:hypothetical protein O6H91_09G071300 [Diphasiastrum complanatum]|uniref:Uncharacterized protein n=1 Tax=Diphasiastrum complanatum TaxID=34168 RepID=A0ACC2CQH0_DIPCM|nr:hypothetical protein O6H91_09G071300 [Diphasiastrum complanatum]